jgi:hypothetical protein
MQEEEKLTHKDHLRFSGLKPIFEKTRNMETPSSKELLISKAWMQVVIMVMLFGFFVMGLLAYYTYTQEPPIPARVGTAAATAQTLDQPRRHSWQE